MALTRRERKLLDEAHVFTQNAWDDLDWTKEMVDAAEARIQEQLSEASDNNGDHQQRGASQRGQVESLVPIKWDSFYRAHGDKFFKDRRWILSEFHEITPFLGGESGSSDIPVGILEVGSGVGNAVVQFLETNKNPHLLVHCCDLSQNAINILKTRPFYTSNAKNVNAFQADISKDFHSKILPQIQVASLDFITIIFTLSALRPSDMPRVISDLASLLKPKGLIFFRDYGHYDLTQLRFKGRSLLGENYYVRADGTTSYFFTLDRVGQLFESAGLEKLQLKEDKRLLVNRLKSLKMTRCWIQAKYMKPDK